ncbi:MAG: MlaD family protein [Gammaproteobacteria bacterium]
MSDARHEDEIPLAELAPPRSLSLFWVIPLVAALIGAWLGWQAWSTRGTEVSIRFARGDGIEAGRTSVRYKAVEVGKVAAVRITPDLRAIEVTARINPDFEDHLTGQTRFWVVRPRIGTSGVSGLNTLVSGAYIEVDPAPGKPARKFTGLEEPPLVTSDKPGREFVLEARELGSLQTGSPLTYKGVEVGETLGHELDAATDRVLVHVFVREPYAALVRESTRFWLASGIDVAVGAEGLDVSMPSLQQLVLGGIEFGTPRGKKRAPPAAAGASFELFKSRAAVAEAGFTERVRYVLYFDESVRGLAAGAPVEFRGIKLGEVTEIGHELEARGRELFIPVEITLHPQRLEALAGAHGGDARALLDDLVERGLRARLQSGNLLTGTLYVDLTVAPDSEAVFVTGSRELPQLPTLPTEFGEFKGNVSALLDKLRRFPLEDIGVRAARALGELEALLAQMREAGVPARASASLAAVEAAATRVGDVIEPLGEQLGATLGTLESGSPLQLRLHETLRQLDAMARSLRQLGDAIERQPESVIWGREDDDE